MIVYTHCSGVEIHVGQTHQMIDLGGICVGPFEPLEIDQTCAALVEEARRTDNYEYLSAASDWRALNEDETEDESYGWDW
jgi:hypothetical protein